MDIAEKIWLLDRNLSLETVNESNEKEAEIIRLINEITDEIISSYESQSKHIAHLLSVYERHNLKSISYLLFIFQELYARFLKLNIVDADLTVLDREVNDDKMLKLQEKVFIAFSKVGIKQVQLSDNFDLDLSENDKKDYIRVMNFLMNGIANKDTLSEDDIENVMLNLTFARSILRSLGQPELFYFFIGTFFDSLYKDENYQLSRDIAEACLLCGHKDGLEDLAYFQAFKAYANTGSAIPALHYGICSLKASLSKGFAYDHHVRNLIWGLVKFYRDIELYPWAIKTFETKPKGLKFPSYDEHSLAHTNFLTHLLLRNESLPYAISEYLDRHREDIIGGGESEVLPWLHTLRMIVYTYPESLSGIDSCKSYIEIFSRIVSPERLKKYQDIATGSSLDNLITHLKKSLVKLASTRNEIDFATDNTFARMISNSLIQKSFKKSSSEGYLYSMIINSDYSLRFKSKESTSVADIKSLRANFSEAYYTPQEIIDFIKQLNNHSIVWLGSNEGYVLPLVYKEGGFIFCNNSMYPNDGLKKWFAGNVDTLPLEHDKIIAGGLKANKDVADFMKEEQELSESLSFTSLENDDLRNILVVKDYELSQFPHNLMTNSKREFYASKTPIMNIMSLEWLIDRTKSGHKELETLTKGIWIPTEVGDFTLNYLYSYIETTLSKNGFAEEKKLLPSKPLDNDINIIAAHGDQSINTFPALYAKGVTESFSIVKLNRIIGPGKILILFVCHSGSMRPDFLRNRIATMIRDYLKAGYEAIIAPFWALDISIPKYWLPQFLESIEKGKTVMDAVFDGNMKVKEVFPTPKAYACLHAYGNPFFKLKKLNGNSTKPN